MTTPFAAFMQVGHRQSKHAVQVFLAFPLPDLIWNDLLAHFTQSHVKIRYFPARFQVFKRLYLRNRFRERVHLSDPKALWIKHYSDNGMMLSAA
jgi:hypothetical protein